MGKTVVVVGSGWGDEGKGKITNYLSEQADVVVRYQGGDNAGHTIVFDGHKYALHSIPSGVFDAKIKNIMGNGMVINPRNFLKELQQIRSCGFSCNNLYISDRANVIFDYHLVLDGLKEERLGARKIGTTKKGIGPAYTDKIARDGIRMIDFVSEDFKDLFYNTLLLKNEEIKNLGGTPLSFDKLYPEYQEMANKIRPLVTDTITLIHESLASGKNILFEGAQGALLDIDFGTYPYVTSSSTSGGGVCSGSGVGPTKINEIIGIVKAYTTRVGEGAFSTEFDDEISHKIREDAHEYGATTGRARRIGWFDGVMMKYSANINGLTGLAVTILDVLSGIKTLKICTSYDYLGKTITAPLASIKEYEKCKPNYIEMPGWDEDISHVTSFEELPENAKRYLEKIEEIMGVPVVIFSVGPDKLQTIVRQRIF